MDDLTQKECLLLTGQFPLLTEMSFNYYAPHMIYKNKERKISI